MRALLAILIIAVGFCTAALVNNTLHLWTIPQARLTGMVRPAPPPTLSAVALTQLNLQARDIPGGGRYAVPSPWEQVTLTPATQDSWHITGMDDATYCTQDKSTCYNSLLFTFRSRAAQDAYYETMARLYAAGKYTSPLAVPALGDATSGWMQPMALYDTISAEATIFVQQGPYFCALSVLGHDASADVLYHTASLIVMRLALYG